jgi:hypothetical protein
MEYIAIIARNLTSGEKREGGGSINPLSPNVFSIWGRAGEGVRVEYPASEQCPIA